MIITIYSKTDCPFCVAAENFCAAMLPGARVNLVRDPAPECVAELKRRTGHKTYPFIFEGPDMHSGKFIGGYTDLVRYDTSDF